MELRHAGYVLESADELHELAKELGTSAISTLEVSRKEQVYPYIDLGKMNAQVTVGGDSLQLLGIETQVRALFNRRRKLLTGSRLYFPLFVLGMFILVATETSLLNVLFGGGLAIAATVCLLKDIPPYSTIYLYRRSDRPGFFTRHGDHFVTAIVAAVLGALAVHLLGKFG
ncbi:MAG: hypothetical protein AB7N24_23300 [Dehalococcoidia bacterium]